MSGLSNLLNIAKSSLLAQQSSMNVVSHNIANANTEGYSKQEMQLVNRPGTGLIKGLAGSGVDSSHVRQRQTQFADRRIFNENSRLGEWDLTQRILDQVEIAFTGTGESDLNVAINDYFNSWEDLSGNPESLEFRNQLIQQGDRLTSKFHEIHEGLTEIEDNVEAEFMAVVEEVNRIVDQVAELNDTVEREESTGGTANDLRDQRRLLLKQLSGLVPTSYSETPSGVVRVSVGGQLLLGRNSKIHLTGEVSGTEAGSEALIYVGDHQVDIAGGEIAGLQRIHDTLIPKYKDKLDGIAREMVTRVNNLHRQGFGLDGETGRDFFVPEGQDASGIRLNADLRENSSHIATAAGTHDYASDVHTSNGPGDNSIARSIADLRNVKALNDRSATFNQAYNDLYADVGFDTLDAKRNSESHQVLMDQLTNYRDSITGVSIDEELADMMKFQNSYNAAARMISVADEMMKTLINILG